ncbi:MAG TPA: hypothetical protein VNA12_00535 [Mycobacteriales bacterium]|nr:hypothetical protein [Mycobacteriales bacterium]
MSDYFAPPAGSPQEPSGWSPPPGESVVPAWSGGGPPYVPPGPWRGRRPAPHLAPLLAVAATLVALGGLLGLLGELADSGGAGALLAGLAAALVTAALWLALRADAAPGALRAAAVTAVFVLAAAPVAFWLTGVDDIGFKSTLSMFLLAAAAAWAAAFLAGPTRGRPVFLAGLLTAAWLLVAVLAVDTGGGLFEGEFGSSASGSATITGETAAPPDMGDDDNDGTPNEFDPDHVGGDHGGTVTSDDDDRVSESINPALLFPFFFGFGLSMAAVGVVSLVFGLGYLAAAWLLDQRELRSSATPFQAVGIAALLTGTSLVSVELDAAGPVLHLATGGLLLWLGALAGRRLTAWLGVALLVGGVVGVAAEIVDSSPGGPLLLLVLGGAGLAAIHLLLPGAAGDDGDEPDEADTAASLVLPPPQPPFA